ncbi:MAG TPA: hypothetical protein VK489_11230 [Ferruginibacter sp.]|nr:hypothetical protein [Ferruginibacter sp.]
MKRHVHYALSLLLSLISLSALSQNPSGSKPKQFSNFPDVINCSEAELSNIFNAAAGQNISLSFSDNFSFTGSITSNIVKYSNLQTAVVRSPFFNNSIFSVSKIINKDNSVSYLGRIINKGYYDGYELKRNTEGKYQLIKMETDRVIQDCRHL